MPRRQRRARRLEQMPVRNARRTYGFAPSAAEASIEMPARILIARIQCAIDERAHEQQASARSVVLVLQREIGRTCLQTEAAMHARIETLARVREWRVRKSAMIRRCEWRDIGTGGHVAAPRIPGLRMPAGSNRARIAADNGSAATA